MSATGVTLDRGYGRRGASVLSPRREEQLHRVDLLVAVRQVAAGAGAWAESEDDAVKGAAAWLRA